MDEPVVDVVVVGGGPTGLLLAGELKLAGIEPLVLEATTASERRARSIHLRGMNVRSLQTLALRGLDDDIFAAQREMFELIAAKGGEGAAARVDSLMKLLEEGRSRGHFGLMPLLGDPSDQRWAMLQPHQMDRVLTEWITSLGVVVRDGTAVVDVVDEGTAVVATLADGSSVRGRYLVGCDGGRSVVRTAVGIEFAGTDATMTGRVASVAVADPSALRSSPRAPGGLLEVSMLPGEIATIEFAGGPDDRHAPLTAAEMQASIRRTSGVPDVTVTRFDGGLRFSDNTRQATTYRRGRVLLAGDAAHVHSPIGGQGLNLGLQDAANLGWKLGLVARGLVGDELLDTYHSERHPIAAWVLRNTRAQVALMRPGPQVEALRDVMREVMALPDALAYFLGMSNGTEIDYAGTGDPYVGKFVPAATKLPDGRGLLVNVRRPGYDKRLRQVDGKTPMLIRPDGYVAWASPAGNDEGLTEALERWFGLPT
ncbi:FAD-dependent monooxygenase [Kribbella sp. NPDC055071]